jgi:3-dehydroquinate synthase
MTLTLDSLNHPTSSSPTQLDLVLNGKKVPLHIGQNILFSDSFGTIIQNLSKNIIIVTDRHLNQIYGKKVKYFLEKSFNLTVQIIEILPGEEQKTRKTKEFIEDEMFKRGMGRDTLLIAFGGGVVLDLASFTASTYLRGIKLILIPTSLLAMVDASIGGKGGVNTPFGKNLIGSFYHPEYVFIDPSFLDTLPKKEFLNGLAEIIKYALITSKDLFDELYEKKSKLDLNELICRSLLIKKEIVEKDERDNGIRSILNFGHTIGHSLELLEDFELSHGEAISLGMIFASFLSLKKKFLEMEDFLKIFSLFKMYNYPLLLSQKVSWKRIGHTLSLDKKAENKNPRFILIEKIGKIAPTPDNKVLHRVEVDELKSSLIWFCNRFVSKKESYARHY